MFSYRHFERSREIFIAVRKSACMRHFINEVLVLRHSAISHLLFTGVQERSRASLGMTIRGEQFYKKAALLYFMRRTTPVDPIEPAEPLSPAIKGRPAPRANPEPDSLHLFL